MNYQQQNNYIRNVIDSQQGLLYEELADHDLDPAKAIDLTYLGQDYDTRPPEDGQLVKIDGTLETYFVWAYSDFEDRKEEIFEEAKSLLFLELDGYSDEEILSGIPIEYRHVRFYLDDVQIIIDTNYFDSIDEVYESISSAEDFRDLGGSGQRIESRGW